jgi:hypothetical protein
MSGQQRMENNDQGMLHPNDQGMLHPNDEGMSHPLTGVMPMGTANQQRTLSVDHTGRYGSGRPTRMQSMSMNMPSMNLSSMNALNHSSMNSMNMNMMDPSFGMYGMGLGVGGGAYGSMGMQFPPGAMGSMMMDQMMDFPHSMTNRRYSTGMDLSGNGNSIRRRMGPPMGPPMMPRASAYGSATPGQAGIGTVDLETGSVSSGSAAHEPKATKRKERAPSSTSFPSKLYKILTDPELQEYIAWLPHGRAWRVLKPKAFEEDVIPKHFRSDRYASFMRQVS